MRTRPLQAVSLLLAAVASLAVDTAPAAAHGYTDSPKSRGRWCQVGEVKNCGGIQYEPQSTEGPKGFPQAGPKDGQLCSAGIERFKQVDAPSTPAGTPWPVTTLEMHSVVTFRWVLTADHATTSFRYFITKDGWDADRPLTRYALELEPFYVQEWNGEKPNRRDIVHENVHVPHRNGHHVILGVWDIADTGNAFYSCADVFIS